MRTGGIRKVCIFLLEFSSTSTISATIEASPPLCKLIEQFPIIAYLISTRICRNRKTGNNITAPLGTAMLRTIFLVQFNSPESEVFSHFSSFDLERIWTPTTSCRVRKPIKQGRKRRIVRVVIFWRCVGMNVGYGEVSEKKKKGLAVVAGGVWFWKLPTKRFLSFFSKFLMAVGSTLLIDTPSNSKRCT